MKGFGDLQKMLKTAKDMQEKMQKELAELRIEGNSGGGMVTLVVDGQKNLISLHIDPEVVNKDDVEMLQDLILAALNEALNRSREMMAAEMSKLTGGMQIPGLF